MGDTKSACSLMLSQHVEGVQERRLKAPGSQVGRVRVQLVCVVGLGALEDDQQHDEHACVDKVADALHAEGQHHLQSSTLSHVASPGLHAELLHWALHVSHMGMTNQCVVSKGPVIGCCDN